MALTSERYQALSSMRYNMGMKLSTVFMVDGNILGNVFLVSAFICFVPEFSTGMMIIFFLVWLSVV